MVTRMPATDWLGELKQFEKPCVRKALRQLANTLLPYAALWAAMIFLLRMGLPYWTILPFLIVAGFLVVRVFVILHDCAHGSFLPSPLWNRIVGYITGVIAFTAYGEYRSTHGEHHVTTGNLDRRGTGDIWTMTVQEYRSSPRWRRFAYRLFRHPLFLFGFSPLFVFVIVHRVPRLETKPRETWSVLIANLGIFAVAGAISLAWGWKTYLSIQIPILGISAAIGHWLFYVQHQFDPSYWEREERWTFLDSALRGSSHYLLPPPLQALFCNVGLHHIHHLRPRIPNYNLRACYDAVPQLHLPDPLTMRQSFAGLRLNLWDERGRKLVGFRPVRTQGLGAGRTRTLARL